MSACSKMDSSKRSTITCATVRVVGSCCGAGGNSTQSITCITPLDACTQCRANNARHATSYDGISLKIHENFNAMHDLVYMWVK